MSDVTPAAQALAGVHDLAGLLLAYLDACDTEQASVIESLAMYRRSLAVIRDHSSALHEALFGYAPTGHARALGLTPPALAFVQARDAEAAEKSQAAFDGLARLQVLDQQAQRALTQLSKDD